MRSGTTSSCSMFAINNYRLVVQCNDVVGIARVRFAGTHDEYDRVDVRKV